MYPLEQVNGTAIGGGFRPWVELISPNGHCNAAIPLDELNSETPEAWGKRMKTELHTRYPDGWKLPPEVTEPMYGKGKWEIRIYE